jgi:hypothetical protein
MAYSCDWILPFNSLGGVLDGIAALSGLVIAVAGVVLHQLSLGVEVGVDLGKFEFG